MCGITGCVCGKGESAVPSVYEGLKRLEYRGYDSAGIAALASGGISLVKKRGTVDKLYSHIGGLKGEIAVGHTRWATHGKPSDVNAHPHLAGGVCIVHNGIIENYSELKEKLLKDGETFLSETDSEVIAALLNRNMRGSLLNALAETVKELKGSYALMAICESGQEIVVAKYKSPLIIGYGDGKTFCASDEPALAGVCSEITVLEDGDFAVVTSGGAEIYDGNLKPVARKKQPLRAARAELSLDGCPHYMLKELREAPASIKNTYAAFYGVREELSAAFSGVKRVILTGCGTAYHAGLLGKKYFESFAKIPAEAETAGEFRYSDPVITRGTAVVAISQSGETADTVEAARLALARGAKVIAVTNNPYSALTRLASVSVPVAAGAEICVAATKSYTGQLAALYLTALTLAGESADGERASRLSDIPALCADVIENVDVSSVAHMCAKSRGVYFMGRDLDYAVAREGSLKLKEVSYIPSEGYPAGELKHGTLALISKKTVSVIIITDRALAEKSVNAVEQVLARKGKAVVLTSIDAVEEELKNRVKVVRLPRCDKYLSPFVAAVALQELAYRTAVKLRRNPDKPRNLAKSVTVE